MEILFNEQALNIDGIGPETTVSEIVELVQAEIKGQGLIIHEVNIDGKILPSDDPSLKTMRVEGVTCLRLFGSTTGDLLQEAVQDSEEVLAHLGTLCQGVSADLRVGKNADAMSKHVELLEGLTWLTSVLEHVAEGYSHRMTESDLELARQNLMKRLTEHLQVLEEAQGNQDWVGMADILEYEFPEILQESRDFFQQLQS